MSYTHGEILFGLSVLIIFLVIISPLAAETSTMDTILDNRLHSLLASYEVLNPGKIISKRSLTDETSQHLHFTAFNKTFHLVLRQSYSGSVSSSLKILSVKAGSKLRSVRAAELLSDFYTGYADGEPDSYVYGYKEGNKLYLTMDDGVHFLNIEPLSRISGNQSDVRLLAYYDDAINSTGKFCASQSAASIGAPIQTSPAPPASASSSAAAFFSAMINAANQNATRLRQRQRRQTGSSASSQPKSVCRMQLVADHTFVDRIASGSFGSTAKSLIKIADDINRVYMETQFVHPITGELYTGVGFELANVVVMESPSDSGQYWAPHFNAQRLPDQLPQHASQYLEAFGDTEQNGIDLAAYCINHLVTFRPMQQNILGLAYLGSANPNNIGGVCSPPSVSNHGRQRMIGRNIGMATYANKDGQPILSRQALLVSVHELGHNMGSEHDPVAGGQPNPCSPSWPNGGPYLMYQIAVTGNAPHHSQFSECSRKQIALVIKARQLSNCFREPRNSSLCGNYKLEEGEQCDPGPMESRCCTAGSCRLKPGAVCSDSNSPCCSNCQFASPSLLCLRNSPLNPCQRDTNCTGRSADCPRPANAPDGTACQFGVGICSAGRCESVCSSLKGGFEPCACDSDEQACLVCCRQPGGNCSVYRQPFNGTTIFMPPNQPCGRGRCLENGTCQELRLGSGQLIVRLWDLIVQSGSNSVATFMWKNIVLTVISLSLLLWLPASLIIAYQDRLDAKKLGPQS